MARNSEKAMAMLNRFIAMKQAENRPAPEHRPYLATECDDLQKAEKWRHQIIREVAKKVSQIQNAGLGEYRIRDLNDEINKLLREKRHWEDRIVELGGPNYHKVGPKMLDHEGKEVPGNRGYKYFGAARDLPGVRELFEQEPPAPPRKTRTQLYRLVDADYYGYRDDDDGILAPLEQEAERRAIAQAVREGRLASSGNAEEEEDIYAVTEEFDDDESGQRDEKVDEEMFVAHVPVPSQKDMEELLVKKKKMELLEKYASSALMAQSTEAKALLGLS